MLLLLAPLLSAAVHFALYLINPPLAIWGSTGSEFSRELKATKWEPIQPDSIANFGLLPRRLSFVRRLPVV